MAVGDPPHDPLLSAKAVTNFADKRRPLVRYVRSQTKAAHLLLIIIIIIIINMETIRLFLELSMGLSERIFGHNPIAVW
jgi:ABC-type uncharacterized transport system permease subunit